MPRPPRISGLGDIVTGNLVSSPYICRSCRHLAWRQRLASHQSLRHASSEDIPFREQVRNRIRPATSVIPDPYSGESYLERRRKERALQKEVRNRQEAEDDDADRDFVPKEYTPSETWDGLEHIGHKGHWRDIEPKPEDYFQAQVPSLWLSSHPFTDLAYSFLASGQLKASRPEHFLAAIHQAVVEIVTLQQAGKDLKLSTLAFGDWHSEVKELLSQTKIEILAGKAHPEFTYPTGNTKGIILGWFLKTQRDRLQREARPAFVNNGDVEDSSEIKEISAADTGEIEDAAHIPEAKEVDVGSHSSEADDTISSTADSMGDYIYDAAEVEKDIVAEDEKLAERQRREFEVQHGRDQQLKDTENWTPFYEGIDAPALGGRQQFLDLKLDFKTELTYFVRTPLS